MQGGSNLVAWLLPSCHSMVWATLQQPCSKVGISIWDGTPIKRDAIGVNIGVIHTYILVNPQKFIPLKIYTLTVVYMSG